MTMAPLLNPPATAPGPGTVRPSLGSFFSTVTIGLVVTFAGLLLVTNFGLEEIAGRARETRDITVPQVVAQHRQAVVASQILRQVTVISSPLSKPAERREALAKAEGLSDAFDSSRDLAVLERFDAVLGRLNTLSYQLDLISLLEAELQRQHEALSWVHDGWVHGGWLHDGWTPESRVQDARNDVSPDAPAESDVLSLRWLFPSLDAGNRELALHALRRLEQILARTRTATTPDALAHLNRTFDATLSQLHRLAPNHPFWASYREQTSRLFLIRLDILKSTAAVERASREVDDSLDQLIAALSEEAAALAYNGAESIVSLATTVFWFLALLWGLAALLLATTLWLVSRRVVRPILAAVSALDRVRLPTSPGSLPTVHFRELAAINETVTRFSSALVKEQDYAQALAKSEALYRSLVETIPHGIIRVDGEGVIRFENEGHRQLLGITSGSTVGSSLSELLWCPPDGLPVMERLGQMLAGREPEGPLPGLYQRNDGSLIDVQIDWCRTSDRSKAMDDLILVLTDITDRRQAMKLEAMAKAKELAEESRWRAEAALQELQSAQKQLIQAEKMASLGTLVAGVAHEVNSPLSVALISGTYLADEIEKLTLLHQTSRLRKKDLSQYLESGKEAVLLLLSNLGRACNLVQSFKQAVHDQATDNRRQFDLKILIENISSNLAPKWRRAGHRLVISVEPGIVMESYPGALAQVLTNLITNSIDHGYEDGRTGTLTISARYEKNDIIAVQYQDDGKGIGEEIQYKIFDPFFTTKRGAGNTGLGLHVTFNMVVKNLGGHIRLETGRLPGACFCIRIPREAPTSAMPNPALG
jgi:PAS domain S-box-containing protein